jgi:hypothetical protein
MTYRAGAYAYESNPGADHPRGETPSENVERHPVGSFAEIVQNPGARDNHYVGLVDVSESVDEVDKLAGNFQEEPIELSRKTLEVARSADRKGRYVVSLSHKAGIVADAQQIRIGTRTSKEIDHGLERTFIAQIAAAEKPE